MSPSTRILGAAFLCLFTVACGDDDGPTDLAMPIDQAVAVDLAIAQDFSMNTSGDGGLINADGGANCGATFSYTTRFVAGRTCSTNPGGAGGASCNTSADCAEVCCTCSGNSNQYMVGLCSDHVCNPAWACLCTNVPAKLAADNVCP